MKNIIVTGANTGIGLGICKQLLNTSNIHLVYTYRNLQRGKNGMKELESLITDTNFSYHQLDVTDKKSIEDFTEWCKKKLPNGIDVLINNAGIATKGSTLTREIAEKTLATNYFGLKNVTLSLYDLIVDNGRVVNVSSGMGQASGMEKHKKKEFLDPDITISRVEELISEFLSAIDDDTWKEKGWVSNSYAVSKLSVNCLTRIWARDDKRGISFVSVCPGWVRTNMGGNNAHRSIEEGAKSVCWAVFADSEKANGKFFRDGEELSF